MKRKLADYTEREKEAAKGNESPAAIRAAKAKGCTYQLLLLLLLLLLLFSAFIHFARVCSRLRYNPPPPSPISQMTSFALIRKMPPRFFSKQLSVQSIGMLFCLVPLEKTQIFCKLKTKQEI